MKKILFIVCFVFSANSYCDAIYENPNDPKGYHWYNDPKENEDKPLEESNKQPEPRKITKENAEKIIEKMRDELNQSKALAILVPTTDNIADYKKKQDQITEMASIFASQWKHTLLVHPELDYNLRYSRYNNVASVMSDNDRKERDESISKLTNKYGLFFFYRGKNEIDKNFAGVVHQFSMTYKVAIVAISVDSEITPYFPLTKANRGIVEKLNINHYPAIMLVDPKNEEIKPLSYGYLSLLDLEDRFLDVSTNFKPNY